MMPKEIIVNFKLTPELKKKMDDLVASGRYASQSELLRESLRRFLDIENSRPRSNGLQAASDLIFPKNQEVKSIEEWASELEDQWITPTKESSEMIEEERTER